MRNMYARASMEQKKEKKNKIKITFPKKICFKNQDGYLTFRRS